MGTASQKSTIDTNAKKKISPNTTLKIVITSQDKKTKEEGKKKDLQKQILNN